MRAPIFQVDAFATRLFRGNPAAVMPLPGFLDDAALQAIAQENNLAETAFLVRQGADYRLRWFTPMTEVPLCGHATLASAAVVMERLEPGRAEVVFHTASGALTVRRAGWGYVMDFPVRRSVPVPAPHGLAQALGVVPVEVVADAFNYLALFDSAQVVRDLQPDMSAIARLDRGGVIVTAPGDGGYDFVSRYFAPAKGIPEDPVTGGAHCALVPFWASRLGKTEFRAFQASPRGGEVACRLKGDRVELEGTCVFYMEGEVHMPDGIVPTAIIASEAPARVKPSNYPEPFASRMQGRAKRPLGDLFGLTNFGVNLTQLAPGRVSALRHAHSRQDEFIYILQGHPTLHTDEGRTRLSPGMCAGFRAGTGNGHCLINETADDVVYLEVGDRTAGDEVSYPDDDLKAVLVEGRWSFVHLNGTPY